MKKLALAAALGLVVLSACSKHKCSLSGSDKDTFGDVAPMTGGAFSCFVSDGELVATHGDTTVDAVVTKYEGYLDKQQWKYSVADTHGSRANGRPYTGKSIAAEKDGKKVKTLVYPLDGKLIETVSSVK